MSSTSLKTVVQKVNPTDFLLKPWCDSKHSGEPSAGCSRSFHVALSLAGNASPSSVALPFSQHLPDCRQGGDRNGLKNLHFDAVFCLSPYLVAHQVFCSFCSVLIVSLSLSEHFSRSY